MAGGDGTHQQTIRMDPNITTRMLGLYGDAQDYLNTNPFQPYPYQRVAYPQLGQIASRNYLSNILGLNQPYGFGFVPPTQYNFSTPSMQFGATDVVPYIPPGGEYPPGQPGDGTGDDGGPTDPDNEGDPDSEPQWSPYGFPLNTATLQAGTTGGTISTDPGGTTAAAIGGGAVGPGTPLTYPFQPRFGAGPDAWGDQLGEAETRYAANVLGGLTGYTPQQVGAMMSPTAQAAYAGSVGVAPMMAAQTGGMERVGYDPASAAAVPGMERVGFDPFTVAQSAGAGDVGGGSYTSQRLGELRNIYEDQVVGQAISDLARARDIAMEAGPGSAAAGAYGGDRQAIREAELDRNFLDSVGRTTAQLRSEGFGEAADLMGRELGLGLQAGLANQAQAARLGEFNAAALNQMAGLGGQLGLQAGLANQGTAAQLGMFGAAQQNALADLNARLGLQAGLANQGTAAQLGMFDVGQQNAMTQLGGQLGLQAGLANQATLQGLNQYNTGALNDMARYNAGLGLQADLANQQAGLSGANLNLGAAGMLSGLGGDLFSRGLQGVSALNQMGTQDQMLAQAMIQGNMDAYNQAMMGPLQGFGTLQGILSGIPVGYSQYGGTNPYAGIGGGALTGAGIGTSILPGWGTLAGGLGGALLGWLG